MENWRERHAFALSILHFMLSVGVLLLVSYHFGYKVLVQILAPFWLGIAAFNMFFGYCICKHSRNPQVSSMWNHSLDLSNPETLDPEEQKDLGLNLGSLPDYSFIRYGEVVRVDDQLIHVNERDSLSTFNGEIIWVEPGTEDKTGYPGQAVQKHIDKAHPVETIEGFNLGFSQGKHHADLWRGYTLMVDGKTYSLQRGLKGSMSDFDFVVIDYKYYVL